jgi:N-acetyl-gamma-glutamyl-phosphate reductase
MDVSIVGATGYTGVELIKILSRHPGVNLTCLTTRQANPKPIQHFASFISKQSHLKLETFNFNEVAAKSDVVFLALPHTESVTFGERFYRKGKIVIDLSADYRLKDPVHYRKWYNFEHGHKGLLKHAVYGLPEYYREAIAKTDLIANPGCYPTSVLLGLGPLLENKLVELDGIIADSKSGVSGAGRKLSTATQFCEVDENFKAYKVSGHQHLPEIEQVLSELAKKKVNLTFVPHLLPIHRGILSTLYVNLKKQVTENKIYKTFYEKYASEPFVRVLPEGQFPSTAEVAHTNFCDIGISVHKRTKKAVIVTAIDNLVKGASGQAVQNMNIRTGFSEDTGLV